MSDDIEHLKVHKIAPRSTSDHVFLPQASAPPEPTAPISEASAGSGDKPVGPVDTEGLKVSIVDALSTIFDPEIPVNIYELGLIYDISVDDEARAEIRMTLTAPACPVAGALVEEVAEKTGRVPGVSTSRVELVWDPPWTPDRMTDAAKLELGML